MEELLRLRDSKSTVEDHEFIMQNCAEQFMTPERINAFKGENTMYYSGGCIHTSKQTLISAAAAAAAAD
jgi:hypothetical protein